jgi:Protein of unknown function (DUF3592)
MGSWDGKKALLTVIAVVAFSFGAYRLWDIWNFSRNALEAQGVIVERTSNQFTIEFTANGRSYQIEEELPSTKGADVETRMRLQPGVYVTVLYDPDSPQDARWKSARNWVFPGALCAIGVLFGLAAYRPNLGLPRR